MSQNLIYKHLSPSLTKYYLKFSIYIKNLIINIHKNLYPPFQKNLKQTNTVSILIVDSVNNVFDTSVVAKKLCTKHKHFYCAIQTGKKNIAQVQGSPPCVYLHAKRLLRVATLIDRNLDIVFHHLFLLPLLYIACNELHIRETDSLFHNRQVVLIVTKAEV